MDAAGITLPQMQFAFAIGLLGVYIGWRGIIAKMTGFYDMAGAFKYLLFGIVSGMVFAVASDEMILKFGVIESQLNILTAFYSSYCMSWKCVNFYIPRCGDFNIYTFQNFLCQYFV